MKHPPNTLELWMTLIIIILSGIIAVTFFDCFVSREYPLMTRLILYVPVQMLILIGLESLVNIFYGKWQRKQ
jgi:hypothetical protein